ncbi:hypothetical protein ACFXI8_27045 [Streptomyces niveus]|uniref:hypothetical protein n=1 Tax=Streptomyces niveus TaxID=193462 RepID=UPI00367B9AB1
MVKPFGGHGSAAAERRRSKINTAAGEPAAQDQDGDHLQSVELLFADIASIRDAVAALT